MKARRRGRLCKDVGLRENRTTNPKKRSERKRIEDREKEKKKVVRRAKSKRKRTRERKRKGMLRIMSKELMIMTVMKRMRTMIMQGQ